MTAMNIIIIIMNHITQQTCNNRDTSHHTVMICSNFLQNNYSTLQ